MWKYSDLVYKWIYQDNINKVYVPKNLAWVFTCSTFLLNAVMLLSQSKGGLPLLYIEWISTPSENISLDTSHDLERIYSGAA